MTIQKPEPGPPVHKSPKNLMAKIVVGSIIGFIAMSLWVGFLLAVGGIRHYNLERARPGQIATVQSARIVLLGTSPHQTVATLGEPEAREGNAWTYPADNGGHIIIAFAENGQREQYVSGVRITSPSGQVVYELD